MKKTINPEAQAIQERFFQALDNAVESGKSLGLRGFCRKHNLNRTKYSRIKNTMGTGAMTYRAIDVDALSGICMDFGVNPAWLLLGTGEMYIEQQPCTSSEQ